jgi:hypothetical protein
MRKLRVRETQATRLKQLRVTTRPQQRRLNLNMESEGTLVTPWVCKIKAQTREEEPGHQWLMPVSQLLRRQRSVASRFKASPGKKFSRPYLEKPFTKIGLVEWLKVKALSSSSRTAKKKRREESSLVSVPEKQL